MELYSISAEQSLLGCILLDQENTAATDEIITRLNVKDDFHDTGNKTIFWAIKDLFNKGKKIDFVTVVEALSVANKLDAVGGLGYLNTINDAVPSVANYQDYLKIVLDLSAKRRMARCGEWLRKQAESGAAVEELIAGIGDVLSKLEMVNFT